MVKAVRVVRACQARAVVGVPADRAVKARAIPLPVTAHLPRVNARPESDLKRDRRVSTSHTVSSKTRGFSVNRALTLLSERCTAAFNIL